jgi:hypothetical protein
MGTAAIGRVGLLVLSMSTIYAEDYPVVTVCEILGALPFYNGKTIIVVGKRVGGMEGSWLVQDCPTKLITDGVEWGSGLSLTYDHDETDSPPSIPQGFKWNQEAVMNKLDEVKRTTKLTVMDRGEYIYMDQWAAILGRLETRVPLETAVSRGGQRVPLGFGHLGGAPAQLVWPDDGILEFPSSGWSLSRKPISHVPAPYRVLQRMLWQTIRAELKGADGSTYFESSMKDAVVPAGAGGVARLRGTVISSSPALWPNAIVLGVSDAKTPEVTLNLDAPWKMAIPPGTEIEFAGVPVGFMRQPFMVTFDVPLRKLTIVLQH